jgi:hypothetical protein
MEKQLKLVTANDKHEDAILFIDRGAIPSIQLRSKGYDSGKVTGEKLFFCLQKLHEKLDALSFKLLCNGCRYDVYPSRMSLDMGGGVKAYKLELGKPGKDMVDIFDPTEDINAVRSVAEQKAYRQKWLESLEQPF